jgi:hypothetical protein
MAAVHGVDEREADAEDVIAEVADRALALGGDRVELVSIEPGHQRLRRIQDAVEARGQLAGR